MNSVKKIIIAGLLFIFSIPPSEAQHSVAKEWNEMLLYAIRHDLARPTVHARNLFHVSAAMYDAWAVYNEEAKPYFLGNSHADYNFEFDGVTIPEDVIAAQEKAISHAAFRIILMRFNNSVGAREIRDSLFRFALSKDLDIAFVSKDYKNDGPAALGNYIADQVLKFGREDGSNETLGYGNLYYSPSNPPMSPSITGNDPSIDPNKWQPLSLSLFIDQSGNVIPFNTPEFLSPEWGNVYPFSMNEGDKTVLERDGDIYQVYHDPGPPPYLGPAYDSLSNEAYKWGFCLVSQWSSHLDTTSEIKIDISPKSWGNVNYFPHTLDEYKSFYKVEGGDVGQGYRLNYVLREPYKENIVSRSDFARVLAEFWADGPDSETPPGHWFTLLNEISDHPSLVKKIGGEGDIVSDLEWDVKSYFILGGAMHDSAISSWGIKGYYDFIRPISALRYMAEKGQSSDPNGPSYDPMGISLIDEYIELIKEGDELAGLNGENINKIKVKAWKGPDFIEDEVTDAAGIGWILAGNWWPYQRPTFVTPNFAGYVSGHSTFSRAAAEVLTSLTGSPFFPDGLGEFTAKKNDFLVFEKGPSQDITLQWATYRDAANQSALSRIWGGIHPPADDIPGRIIGEKIGKSAYEYGISYFQGQTTSISDQVISDFNLFPNPVISGNQIHVDLGKSITQGVVTIYDLWGKSYGSTVVNPINKVQISTIGIPAGAYIFHLNSEQGIASRKLVIF